jgi:tetratricopeptide (TPR) repeat protein
MSGSRLKGILFILFIILLGFGCSPSHLADQTSFGIWAAEKDLWEEAIFRWKKVLQANPDSVAGHNNLAVAYEKKGLWDEARREYETALKLEPQNTWVKSNYQKFQDSMNPEKKEKEEERKKQEKDSREKN